MCLDLRKLYNDTYAAQWEKDRLEQGSGDHAEAQTEAIDAIRAHFDEREKAYSASIKTLSDALTGLGQKVTLDYTNHRGERAMRTVTPAGVDFGTTKWHREPGLLIQCYDYDKAAVRVYAWSGVHSWNGVPVSPSPADPVRAALEEACEPSHDRLSRIEWQMRQHGGVDSDDMEWMAQMVRAALSVSTPTGEGEAKPHPFKLDHLSPSDDLLIAAIARIEWLHKSAETLAEQLIWQGTVTTLRTALAHPPQGGERP